MLGVDTFGLSTPPGLVESFPWDDTDNEVVAGNPNWGMSAGTKQNVEMSDILRRNKTMIPIKLLWKPMLAAALIAGLSSPAYV
jgi:hypothetical protein